MHSMTGHGRASADSNDELGGLFVEIRAVNHRFLDLKFRGLSLGPDIENMMRQKVKKRVARGSVTLMVQQEKGSGAGQLRLDPDVARSAMESLMELRALTQCGGKIDVETLAALPGVITASQSLEQDDLSEKLVPIVDEALDAFVGMRKVEGTNLRNDMEERLVRISELAEEVKSLAQAAPKRIQERLEQRVQALLSEGVVEAGRLAQEVAFFADRADVTEEVVRLKSHVGQARKLLDADGPVGRKMEFVVQEMGREINTIGSKTQQAEVSSLVVEAKSEVERIREQIQNVE